MNEVLIKKNELLDIIKKNRAEHRDIFLKAQTAYREVVVETLDLQLKRVRDGRPFVISEIIGLQAPSDHTRDYDRAIRMIELEVRETITLSEADFANLVQDEWSWSHGWAASNATYVPDSPKLQALLGR